MKGGAAAPLSPEILVVANRCAASAFVLSTMGDMREVADVQIADQTQKKQKNFGRMEDFSLNERVLKIFAPVASPSVLVALNLLENIAPKYLFVVAMELFSVVKPKRVVVVEMIPASFLRPAVIDASALEPPQLRVVRTKDFGGSDALKDVKYLETPLLLQGLGATIISHAQNRSIPALALLSVVDDVKLTSATFWALEKPFAAVSGLSAKSEAFPKLVATLSSKRANHLYL